jgi:hypothetical protein
MIRHGAAQAARMLGVKQAKSQPVDPLSKKSESSGWWWKLPALVYSTYQIVKWGRRR